MNFTLHINQKLNKRQALRLLELIRFVGPVLGSMVLAKAWGAGEALVSFEKLLFVFQAISFSVIWASVSDFYARPRWQPEKSARGSDSVLFLLLSGLGLICSMVLVAFGLLQGFDLSITLALAVYVLLLTPSLLTEFSWIRQGYPLRALFFMLLHQMGFVLVAGLPFVFDQPPTTCIWGLPLLAILRFGTAFFIEHGLRFSFPHHSDVVERIKGLLPLVGSYLLAGSQLYWAGFVVGFVLSDNDFLLFRYGCREIPLAHLLTAPLWMHTAAFMSENQQRVSPNWLNLWSILSHKKETVRILNLTFPAHIVLILAAGYLFNWAYGPKLSSAALPFQILALSALASTLAPRGFLLGKNKRDFLFLTSLYEALFHAFVCVVFTYSMGIGGTALALVLATVFEKVLLIYKAQNEGMPARQWIPWRLYGGYAILLLLALCFSLFVLNP